MLILAVADNKIQSRWRNNLSGYPQIVSISNLTSLKQNLRSNQDATVILHRALPGLSNSTDIQNLVTMFPEANIFVLADVPDEHEGIELIRAGVLGYANTHIKATIFAEAVKIVSLGEIWASKRLLEWMVNHCGETDRHTQHLGSFLALDILTPTEKTVVSHILEGENNKQIARKLSVTERTVKAHLTSIYRKTGVKDRLHLALLVNNHSM